MFATTKKELDKNMYFKPISLKDKFRFTCIGCAGCCRNVKQSVSINSLDIFNIAKHLDKTMEEIISEYTEYVWITESLPLPVLKTKEDDTCIFLESNKCRIHVAKPYVCKIYPLSALPHDNMNKLKYGIASKEEHHFTGKEVSVKEWVNTNMDEDQKELILYEKNTIIAIENRLHKTFLQNEFKRAVSMYLYYKYFNYDMDKPFLPQYKQNTEQLLKVL